VNAAVGHPGWNAGWWHGSGWWWWLWWLALVAVSIGFVVALVWLVQRGEGPRASRARQILAERYARGEISTEEYEQQRRVLED
jgi:putative membrane protein